MPELPDVELFKKYLDDRALHQTIVAVHVNDPRILASVSPQSLASRLIERQFQSSRRHGKHLLVCVDEDGWLTLHFGMTGGLQYVGSHDDEPSYARVLIDFENGRRLAYTSRRMLGRIGFAEDADTFIARQGLGPDALDGHLTPAAFEAALGEGRRSIKAALMDQAAIAGIGNIYSDEILFQAKLHPSTQVRDVSAREKARLFEESRKVLETAIRRNAGSEQFLERLPSGYLLRDRRDGAVCPRCGGRVRAIKLAGRTACYCPNCQPEHARTVGQ